MICQEVSMLANFSPASQFLVAKYTKELPGLGKK
jgi:hypothetical protein